MIKSYLKSAYRNIVRNKFYSIINIVGLAIGIISAIMILLFAKEELTFDKHYKNYERIYRLESDFTISDKNTLAALVPTPMAPTLMDEYPEIENYTRFAGFGVEDILFEYGEKKFYEDNLYFADSTVFKVFDHKFLIGSPENALTEPNKIVITESFSRRYFGDENPVGEVITTSNFGDFSVTGVIEDVPANSHLKFDCLLSMGTVVDLVGGEDRFNDRSAPSFWNISVFAYVLLNENTTMDGLHEKFPEFYDKYMAALGDQINASFNLMSQRLDEVHFHSDLEFELPVGNFDNIIIFSVVGIFMLLIACVNYMNMATARSTSRAKEVGIRKVTGANRGNLIRQFISESIVLGLLALVIALIVCSLVLPWFNILTDKALKLSDLFEPLTILYVVIITLAVGIISGSYPSVYLSSFSPVLVLKGTMSPQQGRGILRKILVVFQFAISVALIIGTLIVTGQQRFIKNKDLGFDKENVLLIPNRDTAFINNQLVPFKEELSKYSDIEGVTTSVLIPPLMASKVVFYVEQEQGMVELALSFSLVDHDFLDVLDFEVLEGRNFSRDLTTDATEAFIINEAAAQNLGWGKEALGKRVQFGVNPQTGEVQRDGVVIGVVKDFHFSSIHNKIEPFIFMLIEDPTLNFYVKLKEENIPETIEFIREKRVELGNTLPFNYFFFTEKIDEMYSSEKKLGYLFTIFSLLTILISCLGLLGLTSFVTAQRIKEIGIRKVLGSSNSGIVILIIRGFLILVLIANVVAWYPSWWAMDRWLRNFEYKTDIGILPFVIAAVLAIVIALITVIFHAARASHTNPAESLKYE